MSDPGDRDAAVHAEAVRHLGNLSDVNAVPVLTAALQEENEEASEAFHGALAFLARGPRHQSAAPVAG